MGTGHRRARLALVVGLVLAGTGVAHADETAGCRVQGWHKVGATAFLGADALSRSQGVSSDGHGWVFSWQAGLSRTDDAYTDQALGTLPPDRAVDNPQADPASGRSHLGGNHIGDIDVHDGLVYAPVEDGAQSLGVTRVNDPEYQRPFVSLFDAATLRYTGRSYPLPLELQAAGVPWVAVDHRTGEVYSAEWEMPHDRLNVYGFDADRTHLGFRRFVQLVYPPSLGAGFHLSRLQGLKVVGHTAYASRDDADKTVFAIDLRSGLVTPVFALAPGVPAELEGLAVRPTSDGALLHVLVVLHNKVDASGDAKDIRTELWHYAPPRSCDD